jgi:hypothetical protein
LNNTLRKVTIKTEDAKYKTFTKRLKNMTHGGESEFELHLPILPLTHALNDTFGAYHLIPTHERYSAPLCAPKLTKNAIDEEAFTVAIGCVDLDNATLVSLSMTFIDNAPEEGRG